MAGAWRPKKVRKDKPGDSDKPYLNPFKTPLPPIKKAKTKTTRKPKKA